MTTEIMTVTVSKITCESCGHTWIAKVANPKECPRCKGYLNKQKLKKEEK